MFHPGTNELLSNSKYKNIVCWLIDSDYDEETFFVRHAYFLGVNDPCKLLKTACRAEINEEARVMLNSDNSRPFRPEFGRSAAKAINYLDDEVMQVFG